MVHENPYQSPKFAEEKEGNPSSLRRRAIRSFRIAIVWLLIPTLYNYWSFDARVIQASRLPSDLAMLYRTVNIAGIVLGITMSWFFGVSVLESIARLLHRLFGRQAALRAWLRILYLALNRVAIFSVPGAVLWSCWVVAFYRLDVSINTINWIVGVPAHLLAACVYLPLIIGWYRLSKSVP